MANWAYQISRKQPPDQLRRVGPLIPGAWTRARDEQPTSGTTGYFLLDSGAGGVAIDEGLARELGLKPIKKNKEIHGVAGVGNVDVFLAWLFLPAEIVAGGRGVFRVPVECTGVPGLREHYGSHDLRNAKGEPIPVIGILGRNFTQFALMTIDGTTGAVDLKIDKSIHLPRD